MLTVQNISVRVGNDPEATPLLQEVSLEIPKGHLAAIIGPSGSGKSTLLKVIAGVSEADTPGSVFWDKRDLAEEDLDPSDVGYVPQFGIAYDQLTIQESVDVALQLRVGGLTKEERQCRATIILLEVGLEPIADRRVKVLSGGEKRRLALALEMVSEPVLLLCDEVTSGLDPKSEEDTVNLLHRLSRKHTRIVISVTHSLRHLALYDSVAVFYQGHLAYHGPGESLLTYFGVSDAEQVFPALAKQSGTEWDRRWRSEKDELPPLRSNGKVRPQPTTEAAEQNAARRIAPSSSWRQFEVLLRRRWRIFVRDRSQVWLHLALLFGFPCLVVIFALNGLPQIQNLNMRADINMLQQLRETASFILQSTKVGSLVSGLVMFQVILLTLMGANNAAREVAAERLIFEKEKLGGLHPSSYLASKSCYLLALVAAQSVWMSLFVSFICRFPGDFLLQTTLLFLVNAAMSSVCLGISSLMKSPEQASMLSIYLVGFQLPLSGAVLALPHMLGLLTRPFIAAYWSWSGLLQTMKDTRFYDVVQTVTQTELSAVPLCLWALGCHVVIGSLLAYVGCKQSRWE